MAQTNGDKEHLKGMTMTGRDLQLSLSARVQWQRGQFPDGEGRHIRQKQLADLCTETPPAQSTEQVINGDHPEGELEDGGESGPFPSSQLQ